MLFVSCVTKVALFARSRIIGKIAVIRSRPFGGNDRRDRAAIRFRLVRLLDRILIASDNLVPAFSITTLSLLYVLFIHPRVRRFRHSYPNMVSLETPPIT